VPNKVPLELTTLTDIGWWGDASSSFGMGIVVGNQWAAWKWATGVRVGPRQQFDIGWAEAVAVELGLCLVLLQGYKCRTNQHQTHFLVRSDNAGVVAVLNKGRSKSSNTNAILKHIFNLQACSGLRIFAEYVQSRDNVSDALSRGNLSEFIQNFPTAAMRAYPSLPPHLSSLLVPA
jgi:hypothetical protein